MEVLKSFGHFVFLTQFYLTVSQDMITIIRNPGDGNHWTDLDQFKLPDSKCSSSNTYCTNWKALPLNSQPCHCECSYTQEATFGFYYGSWTCLKNTEVRKQTGNCKYKFQSEQDGFPLKILDQSTHYNVILPSSGCSVDQTKSRYFICDGSSAGIASQSFSQWFSINSYKVTIGSGISTHLLGRIISLNIICQQEQSCLLFKLKGTFQCAENVTSIITSPSSAIPITNTTAKPNYDAKASGVSSTVVGVVVTLVIIVVIVIVIVAYVYLKRKRGESVWLVDYISSSATKVRDRWSSKAKEEVQQQEKIYAEITDQPVQPPTDSQSSVPEEASTQTRTPLTRTVILLSGRSMLPEESTDDDGYAEPPDSPVYNELEDTNEQSTDNDGGTEKLDSYSQQEGSRGVAGSDVTSSVSVPGSSNVVDKRYAANQRRKPPSPPQKGNDTKERGFNVNDGTDVKGHGEEGNNKNHDYETLRDDNRDVYQPLDRNTMNNR